LSKGQWAMGETSIEWCDYTFNPWIGCTKVSSGCKNCYASVHTFARVSGSRGLPLWGPDAQRHRTSRANWREPLRWAARARAAWEAFGAVRRPRVFCGSLMDVFEDYVLESKELKRLVNLDEWREDLWELIDATPELDWLLLTKRPENVLRMVPRAWVGFDQMTIRDGAESHVWVAPEWPERVWVGTSVENQATADERISRLREGPAPVKFLSIEPLVGPVHLEYRWLMGHGAIQWVIVGGESGPGARPMHPDWVRSIRDQCQAAGVPFFFKQWGGKDKAAAGRMLDGRTWDEMPEVTRGI